MQEKSRLIGLVTGLSSWCQSMSEKYPHAVKIRFFDIMNQTNRFMDNFENNIESLTNFGMTYNKACVSMREALFDENDDDSNLFDSPDMGQILSLCLDLGIKAPIGWHGHFMLNCEEYRLMIRPRKDKFQCPPEILETYRKNRNKGIA